MPLLFSTQMIVDDARARGWKAEPLDEDFVSTVAITPPNGRTYYFDSCQPPLTSGAAMVIANDKLSTYLLAERIGVPTPPFQPYRPETAAAFLAANKDIVVKPIDANHGDGITVGVTTQAALEEAVTYARTFSKRIVLQARVHGDDARVVVVDGKVVAASRRIPAFVVGDGRHTVGELIDLKNDHPDRATRQKIELSTIDVFAAQRHLGERILDVPAAGEHVPVVALANVSKGGEAEDITDTIHPSFKEAALKIARTLDMFLCGVDFLAQDLTTPLGAGNGALLEINATPGLRMHKYPARGTSRDVAHIILDAFAAKIAGTNT